MTRSIIVYGGAIVAIVLITMVRGYRRTRELDSQGNPIVRYLGDPYIMILCGAAFLLFGVYQWFLPVNHHYSGNLLLVSYLPAAVGICALAFAAHLFAYRITLRNTTVQTSGWPFKARTLSLGELEAVEETGNNTILKFFGGKKVAIYANLSGRVHFLAALRANNSIQRTPTRYAGRRR